MLEKLDEIRIKYESLGEQMADPELVRDPVAYRRVAQAHAQLSGLVEKFGEYEQVLRELQETREILAGETDPEMREMADAEQADLLARQESLEGEIQMLLLPRDPLDEKNVIMEIRAGAGGDEASLFAGDLYRMYARYAEKNRWKTELLSSHESDLGGFKEVIFSIEGQGAYSRLKFESGVHRVQRIPTTESGGRIHTSTVTVAVLPEAEEVDVEIDPGEIRVDIFCSSGPGGQSVNTTQSAVRITHLPTGMVVSCQDEKSQHKNKARALKVLRSRLLERAQAEAHGEQAEARRSQVGTGDRSERIRTYNMPQNRITDHRIGLSFHRLELVLAGDLDEFIEALVTHDQTERMKNV